MEKSPVESLNWLKKVLPLLVGLLIAGSVALSCLYLRDRLRKPQTTSTPLVTPFPQSNRYTNSRFGFEFEFPEDFTFKEKEYDQAELRHSQEGYTDRLEYLLNIVVLEKRFSQLRLEEMFHYPEVRIYVTRRFKLLPLEEWFSQNSTPRINLSQKYLFTGVSNLKTIKNNYALEGLEFDENGAASEYHTSTIFIQDDLVYKIQLAITGAGYNEEANEKAANAYHKIVETFHFLPQ